MNSQNVPRTPNVLINLRYKCAKLDCHECSINKIKKAVFYYAVEPPINRNLRDHLLSVMQSLPKVSARDLYLSGAMKRFGILILIARQAYREILFLLETYFTFFNIAYFKTISVNLFDPRLAFLATVTVIIKLRFSHNSIRN